MDAAWVAVALTALGMLGTFIAVLIKVSLALSANTLAVKELSRLIAAQKAQLDDHEKKITQIEMIHKLRGCDEAIA